MRNHEIGSRFAASGGHRRWVLASILAAGVWAAYELGLELSQLIVGEGGLRLAGEFLSRAVAPALTYESAVPEGTTPLLLSALGAAWETVLFAAGAMGLAVVAGILLGFVASTAWWSDLPRGRSRAAHLLRRFVAPFLHVIARVLIALMRSVHELLWAVLFLAAFGLSRVGAVIALALPCAGILAKIYSELVDEAPRDSAEAIRAAGASPLQVYFIGLVPRALEDMLAYTLYRFECALRSSAVLGFFGYPTLGYYIAASFENLHYGEVWTYLYTLFLLIVVVDWWSGRLRRSMMS